MGIDKRYAQQQYTFKREHDGRIAVLKNGRRIDIGTVQHVSRYGYDPTLQEEYDKAHQESVPSSGRRKQSWLERVILWPIVVTTRILAIVITLAIWFVVIGPVWLAMLLRTIAAFAFATVVALFSGAPPPHNSKLDAIAELWIRGFGDIIGLSGVSSG